jgi:hypothetical protein
MFSRFQVPALDQVGQSRNHLFLHGRDLVLLGDQLSLDILLDQIVVKSSARSEV